MNNNKTSDLNRKSRNALYIVAVLNLITAVMFWFAYDNTGENLYMIASVVNLLSAIVILILTRVLIKKDK